MHIWYQTSDLYPSDERNMIQKAGWKEWDILRGILSKYVLGGRTKGNLWSVKRYRSRFSLPVIRQMQEIIEFWDNHSANGKILSGERQDKVHGRKISTEKAVHCRKSQRCLYGEGFKKVTMKDIVEACDISRGGLYLYFESTSQIFSEKGMESEEADGYSSDSITEDATAADILLLFLKEQKRSFAKNTLTQATYEFYFEMICPSGITF